MTITACINEIFSSLQGEGVHAGEKMTFIRFANCTMGCKWCDTDYNPNKLCKVFKPQTDQLIRTLENPLSIIDLNELLENYTEKIVAITGGEPLEQLAFLQHFLPGLHQKRKILLETNGIFHKALRMISDYIDIISMDIKLPSSTGKRPFWKEHKEFLNAALESGKEIYVKLVVTSATTDKDVNDAIKLISTTNRYIPVVLQPVTPNENFTKSISDDKLLSFKRLFGAWLPNVSITPQLHKEWGIK